MTSRLFLYISLVLMVATGCNNNKVSDASGTFEVDEVIVSAEVPGKIMALNIEEGSVLAKDSIVGYIDTVPLDLQKAQMEATIGALHQKITDVKPEVKYIKDQIIAQQAQLQDDLLEKARTEKLIKADAATTKQLDDLNSAIDVLQKQIAANREEIKVQETTIGAQNSTVMSEFNPLRKSVAQIEDQLRRTNILNPINGTVLTKYALAGEEVTAGKALYKIGDLSVITLRAYITETQLAQVKLNQQVTVLVDSTENTYRHYTGTVVWISDKAEFTPKTIQTKDERANLVYAIKIHVKNDGYLKIGMYGEVKFK
jgi:HlyD family secretion protein